jgi:hypothetical protein
VRSIRRPILLALLVLASCEGTTLRCDPTFSWTTTPPIDDAGPREASCGPGRRCPIASVAAGARHTCVSTSAGHVVCFGANEDGQSDPVRAGATEVAPTLVGAIASAGMVPTGQLPLVAAGSDATCVAARGALRCWGHPAITGGARAEIVEIEGGPYAGVDLAALHACALGIGLGTGGLRMLEVRCFGAWDGRDPAAGPAFPPALIGPVGVITHVAGFRSCALAEGSVTCRGGAPPDGVLAPGAWNAASAEVAFPSPVVELALAPEHACAVAEDRRATHCWGRGDRGQLGDGSATSSETPVEVGVDGAHLSVCVGGSGAVDELPGGVLAAAPQPGFTCMFGGFTSGGSMRCWGANDRGQLGDGTLVDRATPSEPLLPELASGIACGGAHACAYTFSPPRMWCWGSNDRGQLGVPSSELSFSAEPIEVDLFPSE